MDGLFVTLTPVQRRADTILTRPASLDDGKAWTTARCNRLLRPLISRVSALGRLPSETTSPKVNAPSTDGTKCEENDASRREEKEDEWNPVKKKLKRTYSARSGKTARGNSREVEIMANHIPRKMPRLVPGEIVVSTPILNRAKGRFDLGHSSPLGVDGKKHKRPKSRYVTKDGDAHFELSEILREQRRKTDPSRYTLYEGIYYGLETLLKATMAEASPALQQRTGARSLFITCLRAVPVAIKAEEELSALEERSAVEVPDVSSEIYAELEALGLGDRGWKHLRTIVRAHGIQIVGDAICQGLVKTEFAHALVLLCVHVACLDEAESLLSCLLKVVTCHDPKSIHSRTCDEPRTLALSVLDKFAHYTGRRSFQIRHIKKMLVDEQLPLAWLATKEFGHIWTHVIQSASNPDSSAFLTELLPMMCTSVAKIGTSAKCGMQKALDATLASALTALSAIHLLNTPQCPGKAINALQHPGTVLRQCLISCSLRSSLHDHRASLLAMSNLIISSEHESQDVFDHISKTLSFKPTQKFSDSISSFISSVACCCGRGAFNSGFEHLQLLHGRLRTYFVKQTGSTQRVIWEVMVDSAFAFARRHDECKHLDYAESLESEFHAKHIADLPRKLEAGGAIVTGFRWEEGISEWVTKTPALAPRKPLGPRDGNAHYDSSPLRHSPSKGRSALRVLTQTTTPMKPSREKSGGASIHRQCPGSENTCHPSTEREDEPVEISLPRLASDHDSPTISEPSAKIHRNDHLPTRRRHGLHSQSTWHPRPGNASDDELSASTAFWNPLLRNRRTRVSVLVPVTPTCETRVEHRSARNGAGAAFPSETPSPRRRQRRKPPIVSGPDSDSEDELCL